MSSYICKSHHLSALAHYYMHRPKLELLPLLFMGNDPVGELERYAGARGLLAEGERPPSEVLVARILWEENVRSVRHTYPNGLRYPNTGRLPGGQYAADGSGPIFEFDWAAAMRAYTAIQIIKGASCYRYQAGDHPEWHGSVAEQISRQILKDAVTALPGWDEAVWGIPA